MIERHPLDTADSPDVPPAQDEEQRPRSDENHAAPAPGSPAADPPDKGEAADDTETTAEEPAPDAAEPDAAEPETESSAERPANGYVEQLWDPEHEEETVTPSPTGPRLALGFNLAKIPDRGEDADPIVRHGRDLGLVAVFDGMGGAGGTVYETAQGPRTGAYLASRVVRDVVEPQMLSLLDPDWNLDGPAAARHLHDAVKEALVDTLGELNAPTSGLRSRLIRALPTTMATMALQRSDADGDQWTGHLLWIGDSRAYVFDPHTGAHQLTTDDLRDGGDAMLNLRQDSVLSNVISADTDFVVRHREVDLGAPFVAIAATDGCFGYLPSPMHFEHLVLAALRDSRDTQDWSARIQAAISAVAGDDAAMGLLAVGADHRGLRSLFATRTAELERDWISPLDELAAEVRLAEQALDDARHRQLTERAQLWNSYKAEYERHLSTPDDKDA